MLDCHSLHSAEFLGGDERRRTGIHIVLEHDVAVLIRAELLPVSDPKSSDPIGAVSANAAASVPNRSNAGSAFAVAVHHA